MYISILQAVSANLSLFKISLNFRAHFDSKTRSPGLLTCLLVARSVPEWDQLPVRNPRIRFVPLETTNSYSWKIWNCQGLQGPTVSTKLVSSWISIYSEFLSEKYNGSYTSPGGSFSLVTSPLQNPTHFFVQGQHFLYTVATWGVLCWTRHSCNLPLSNTYQGATQVLQVGLLITQAKLAMTSNQKKKGLGNDETWPHYSRKLSSPCSL